MKRFLLLIILLGTAPALLYAQARDLQAHPDWPAASPTDTRSPEDLVKAFFTSISAPKGGTLDQKHLNSLFLPSGRIEVPLPADFNGDKTDVVFLTPSQYAVGSDKFTSKEGFYDCVIGLHVQRFGVIAHVFASYASRHSPSDTSPFQRGIKSFELIQSGPRWYIVQVSWDNERHGLVIPDRYLENRDQ